MNTQIFSKLFPYGTHLCREPMPPMSEMKRDMEIMRQKGFNLIKLQENWMLDEPEEGCCDFSKYQELIEHAARLDLGVYLGLTCEQAPNWLFRKYPGAHMVGRDGLQVVYQAQSTLPADGKPGPCYDHHGAMTDQLRFIKKLVSVLGRYENIVVWNTWQEIGYWAEGLAGSSVCYCPNTIRSYQAWLAVRYEGKIDQLNQHWNVRYSSFEDIYPERSKRSGAIPQEFFFRYFMDHVQVANVLRARYDAIKEADPLNRPIFAHKGSPALASGLDWTYARTQDFLGTSNYPGWGCGNSWDDHRQGRRLDQHDALYTELWDNLAYRMDHIRSASRPGAPVWAAEYQGGPVSTDFHLGRQPTAEDMRRWLLTTLGAGATGISFWVTRAEIMAPETNGFALLDSEGEKTERMEEAARIGKALNSWPELFNQNNREPAEVAILLDEWNYQQLSTMKFASDVLAYSVRGWYRLLWDLNICCDLIEAAQLKEERTLQYKAIIAPMPLSMSDAAANNLAHYAQSGGHVILEAAPGRLNEAGFAVRGEINPVIRSLMHISQKRFQMVREPGETDRWSQPERTWGEYAEACFLEGEGDFSGSRIRANMYLQTFNAESAQVIFRIGSEAAGISQSHGEGKIWLLGTYVGPGGTAYRDGETTAAVQKMLLNCGVQPSHHGRLLLRKRIGSGQEAWFITNPCRETVSEALQIPAGRMVTDLLDQPLIRIGNSVQLTIEPLSVQVLIVNGTDD